MVPQDTVIPEALLTYMEGLKTHDLDLIGSTFADYIRFVTPVWTAGREQVLDFLGASGLSPPAKKRSTRSNKISGVKGFSSK